VAVFARQEPPNRLPGKAATAPKPSMLRTRLPAGAERRIADSQWRQLTSRACNGAIVAPGANTFALALGKNAGGLRRKPHLRPQRLCSSVALSTRRHQRHSNAPFCDSPLLTQQRAKRVSSVHWAYRHAQHLPPPSLRPMPAPRHLSAQWRLAPGLAQGIRGMPAGMGRVSAPVGLHIEKCIYSHTPTSMAAIPEHYYTTLQLSIRTSRSPTTDQQTTKANNILPFSHSSGE
jgi:hypothetical protein